MIQSDGKQKLLIGSRLHILNHPYSEGERSGHGVAASQEGLILFLILDLWTKQPAAGLLCMLSHLELQYDTHQYSNISSFVHWQLL